MLWKDDDLFAPLVRNFVDHFLFAPFEHGDPAPTFSRHAILHGADLTHGTASKSIRALIWVDCVLLIAEEKECVALPDEPDPRTDS